MAGASGSSRQGPAPDKTNSIIQEKEQETLLKKKYGGLVPKKPPLIAKDNERAFFDSADWALCKQGSSHQHQHQRTHMESLPPKLQPTPHQQRPARRASYVPPSSEGAREMEEVERRRRTVSMCVKTEASSESMCAKPETCGLPSPSSGKALE